MELETISFLASDECETVIKVEKISVPGLQVMRIYSEILPAHSRCKPGAALDMGNFVFRMNLSTCQLNNLTFRYP